ncbi:hypothetical protein [Amnibacterium sp.]|uniref:hypothetical protein n=1 Tax=Amnibacterium sp. TaxID=1872496 RepID=UPI002610574A|nr:hypothetical protein [Amnibacterium sp.]MCU1472594.1 hypothetical protein [Amnibacterium sp.]
MATLIRTWLGLGALGAGLVHLAVAAGAPPATLVPLVVLGVAEVGWGVAALARLEVPVPRVALAVAVVAVVGVVAALVLNAGAMAHMGSVSAGGTVAGAPAVPMLGAALLDLGCAAALAVVVRRGRRPDTRPPGVWSYLGGVVTGAAVVAGITVASLGATPVGALAMQGMGH